MTDWRCPHCNTRNPQITYECIAKVNSPIFVSVPTVGAVIVWDETEEAAEDREGPRLSDIRGAFYRCESCGHNLAPSQGLLKDVVADNIMMDPPPPTTPAIGRVYDGTVGTLTGAYAHRPATTDEEEEGTTTIDNGDFAVRGDYIDPPMRTVEPARLTQRYTPFGGEMTDQSG